MNKIIAAIASVICLLSSSAAHADVFRLDFTAVFGPGIYLDTPAPQNPLTGSIVFSAASYGADIISIDAVDLTIGNHSYTVDEIGGTTFGGDGYLFGAKFRGINIIGAPSDDFALIFASNWKSYTYSIAASDDVWDTSQFTGTISAVPEPGTWAMMSVGFAGLLLARRRGKQQA